MKYRIIHPENAKNPAEWWQGNPRVEIDFHYGELTHFVNRLEQLAKQDQSAYPMDSAMMLLRELILIRDKASLERQLQSQSKLAAEYQREAGEHERRAKLLEEDVIVAEQDLTRQRQVIKQRDERIQALSLELARLESERPKSKTAFVRSAASNGHKPVERPASKPGAFKPGDRVRVIAKWLTRSGDLGTIIETGKHGPYSISVAFGDGYPRSVYRPDELELVTDAAATDAAAETAAIGDEPVVVPV